MWSLEERDKIISELHEQAVIEEHKEPTQRLLNATGGRDNMEMWRHSLELARLVKKGKQDKLMKSFTRSYRVRCGGR